MNATKIEWALNPDGTQGYTWNPITGCLNGCPYCYARKLANTRLKERYLANHHWTDIVVEHNNPALFDPFYPRFWSEKLTQPHRRKKPAGIFTCDMSDLFGIGIPQDWTEKVLLQIARCPQHRFYLLTKQPQNLIKFSPFPDNCWVGVSAGNLGLWSKTLWYFTEVKAGLKYLSIEPLQEHIIPDTYTLRKAQIDWIIIGAQTKPYKPPKIEWVREIVEAADKAGIPVLLKNNLVPLIRQEVPLFQIDKSGFIRDGDIRQEMPK